AQQTVAPGGCVGAWLGCPIAPLTGWETCGGVSATDRNCGPKKAFAGVQSSHNDFPWRGVKSSIPYLKNSTPPPLLRFSSTWFIYRE
ncbi:MAG: hypothetical protein Q8Q84_19815, partial [Hydrogenophaga sp.]|nr:hypothetical protein [Hydrogenophaga sp.]